MYYIYMYKNDMYLQIVHVQNSICTCTTVHLYIMYCIYVYVHIHDSVSTGT